MVPIRSHWQSGLKCHRFCFYVFSPFVLPGVKGSLLLFYAAIFPSVLSQTFYMRGVELTGANRAGLYVNMVPIFTAFLAMLILSETMYLYHIMALLMVLGGIFLAQFGKAKT